MTLTLTLTTTTTTPVYCLSANSGFGMACLHSVLPSWQKVISTVSTQTKQGLE